MQEDQATAFATATVTIRDVNDSPPQFNKKEYVVSIAEDIEVGTLLPDMDMIVTDPDLVSVPLRRWPGYHPSVHTRHGQCVFLSRPKPFDVPLFKGMCVFVLDLFAVMETCKIHGF